MNYYVESCVVLEWTWKNHMKLHMGQAPLKITLTHTQAVSLYRVLLHTDISQYPDYEVDLNRIVAELGKVSPDITQQA